MGKHNKLSMKAARAAVADISPTRKPRQEKTSTPTTAPSASSSGKDSPLFFFREEEDDGYLCQWYRCTFSDAELPDLAFNCAEQYMMYKKAVLFNDTAKAAEIMKSTNPRKQKGLAREVANYDEAVWDEHKSQIVERGNILKFTQCTNLASMKMDDQREPTPPRYLLLATKNRELVEAFPFDRTWGVEFRAREAASVSRSQWGQKLLG